MVYLKLFKQESMTLTGALLVKTSFATEADWEEFLTETGSELPISNDPTIEVDPKTGTLKRI